MKTVNQALQRLRQIFDDCAVGVRQFTMEVLQETVRIMGQDSIFFDALLSVLRQVQIRPPVLAVARTRNQDALDDQGPNHVHNQGLFLFR